MKRIAKEIEITGYTDYLPYLTDLVAAKKKSGLFSYRLFCRKSGFRSPAYLKWIIDGVRPISTKSAHRFALGLSLDKQETQYFILMVNYKEAPDPQTKAAYYEQMLAMKSRFSGTLSRDAYEYLSHWYYLAIRELIALPRFTDDPKWIAAQLGGDLSAREIKNGLETLERLGLIRKKGKKWEQTARDLLTEYDVVSLAAYNYHTEMLELAQKALTTRPVEKRDYQSIVALVDAGVLGEVKSKIRDFQNGMLKFLQENEGGKNRRELYALNMQLLPLGEGKGNI